MYKYTPLLFILIFSCKTKPQPASTSGVKYYPFATKTDYLNLKKSEKQDDALKDRYIKSLTADYKHIYAAYTNSDSTFDSDSLKKALHVYDINGDGRNDLIFTGRGTGEADITTLILNTGQGFEDVFEDMQYLEKLEFTNGKITSMYIDDPGCCDAYIDFCKIYAVTYQGDTPTFKLVDITASHEKTLIPDNFFDKPVRFEVLNNGYKLRGEPVINDTTEKFSAGGQECKGNSIGTISKGAKGTAIAAKTDNTGRVWWFVELDADTKLVDDMFYEEQDVKLTSRKTGWISSRYVKRLSN